MTISVPRGPGRITPYHRFIFRYKDFTKEVEAQQTRCNQVLARLELETSPSKRRDQVRKLLRDGGYHLVSAFWAIRRVTKLEGADPASVRTLAESFNAFQPVYDEPFVVRPVSKGGSSRLVQDFGFRRRMQQRAVARILRALHPPLESQKLYRGGMPMARRAIEAAVARGNRFGVEVDFVNFYPSLRPDALPDLLRPLPPSVTDAVVWDAVMHSRYPDMIRRAAYPAPSSLDGLSLGSACSPIVGEKVIASVLEVARLEDVVTFADNLFVLGRSEEDVGAKIHALRDAVRSQPFGELGLRMGKERGFSLELPFEFTKQMGILRENDEIHWSPGPRKRAQFAAAELPRLSREQIEAADKRIIYWRRAYPDWHDGDAFASEYRAALAVRRFYLTRHPVIYQRAIEAVILAYYERLAVEPQFEGGLRYFVPEEGDTLGDGHGRIMEGLERHLISSARAVARN